MNLDPYLMSFSDAATFEAPALHPNTMQDMQPQKKRARTLREKDWEPCKPRITELLSTQKPQLAEVKLLIEKEFNFTAEDRQWKSRLKQWGLERNIKPKEMKAIVRNRQQRRLVETDKRDLKFRVRGHEVEPQKIERWMKRYDVMESALYAPSPAASTPSAVSYATLSEIGSPGPYGAHSPGSVHDADMNMDSSPTTPRQEIHNFPKTPPQNINNALVTPQQDLLSPPTTPRPFNTDKEPLIHVVKKINDTHFYIRWQDDFSETRFDGAINFIMLKLPEILTTDPLERTVTTTFRDVVHSSLSRYLGRHYALAYPSTLIDLMFYIRHVPLTALNLTETVNIRIRFPGLSDYDMGFDFVSDGLSRRECRFAWIGYRIPPVFSPYVVLGWRTSVVLANELESFPWPDDNEEL